MYTYFKSNSNLIIVIKRLSTFVGESIPIVDKKFADFLVTRKISENGETKRR